MSGPLGPPTEVRSVAVPRAAGDARLTDALVGAGLHVVSAPLVSIEATADQVDGTAAAISDFGSGVLVVTSANGVAVVERAGGPPTGGTIAAVGTSTARAAAEVGWKVDLVPETHTAAALADLIVAVREPGPVLYVTAAAAGEQIERTLGDAGFDVRRVVGYASVPHRPPTAVLRAARRCDVVVFTAGSTVRRWVEVVGTAVPGVSIGPSTTAAADLAGQPIVLEADVHDFDGLVDAVSSLDGSPAPHRIVTDD